MVASGALENPIGRTVARTRQTREKFECSLAPFARRGIGRTSWPVVVQDHAIPHAQTYTLTTGETESCSERLRAKLLRPPRKMGFVPISTRRGDCAPAVDDPDDSVSRRFGTMPSTLIARAQADLAGERLAGDQVLSGLARIATRWRGGAVAVSRRWRAAQGRHQWWQSAGSSRRSTATGRTRGVKSPDEWDAVALTFAESV